MDRPRVVITMPAYRAEATLPQTLADIPAGLADEIILVDDASPDRTAEVARSLGLTVHVHGKNRGYGGNQKTCYTEALRADADIVVMLHPDYQYDPKAVPLLMAPILAGDADMTFGSRFAGLSDPLGGGMPLYRFLGNRVTTTLENIMLGSRFTDLHSGMRAYTRRCLLSIPFNRYSDDFDFDSQFLVDAVTSGQRVVEVPIPTRYTRESSSISIGPSLRYVGNSLAYAARYSASRGRRGRRWPLLNPRPYRPPAIYGPPIQTRCVVCDGLDHSVVYPKTATSAVQVEEFACTTSGLGAHDDIVRCMTCGMISSWPLPSPEELSDLYSDVIDDEYFAEEPHRREVFEWFCRNMGGYTTPGRDLLEVGAHVGLFLDVARTFGWDVRGIEPSKWAVDRGHELYAVPLEQGTIETWSEEPGSADVVVMLDVLEHVADPREALEKIRAVLRPEGLLILSTVNLSGVHARLVGGSWPWFIRSHLHYFSEDSLVTLLGRAGFEPIEWSLVPRSFHLSYIAGREREHHPSLARVAGSVARTFDPKVPLGWLGDITFVASRPTSR